MKKTLIIISVFAVVCILHSCNGANESHPGNKDATTDANNTGGSKDQTDSTRGVNPPTDSSSAQTTTDKETTDFVMKAASGGMLEVQLGQLAQQKAKNARVKSFGDMMVTDHSKANDELKALASSKNITVPTTLLPAHQKHVDMMSKMSGSDFDKHYMDMMVDDHKEDINEFKKESGSTKDDGFKDFAAKTLPVLQKHLDSALSIHKSMK